MLQGAPIIGHTFYGIIFRMILQFPDFKPIELSDKEEVEKITLSKVKSVTS